MMHGRKNVKLYFLTN